MSVQTEYVVAGMSCEHCVTSVTNELTRMDGIMSVGVDLVSGRVAVTSARPLDESDVRAAIDEAGYELVGSGRAAAL